MEHLIIDPVRDVGTEESDVEDALVEAAVTGDVQERAKIEKQASLIEQISSALGITKTQQAEPYNHGRGRSVLGRKQPLLEATEGKKLLAGAEVHSSDAEEGKKDADAADGKTEPQIVRATTLMEHIAARSKSFVVFTISPFKLEREHLQTQDLLLRIHRHNKEDKLDDSSAGAVRVRDIRLFLSSGRSVASIVSRRNCLLVSLPYVKMVILHSQVWLIPMGCNNFPRDAVRCEQTEERCRLLQSAVFPVSGGGTEVFGTQQRRYGSGYSISTVSQRQPSFIGGTSAGTLTEIDTILLEKLQQLVRMQSNTPFEYLALETGLVESSDVLRRQIRVARYTAFSICTSLRRGVGVTSAVLLRINGLRKIINTLKQEVTGVVNSLNEVLGDDETLRRVTISEFWDEPQLWEGGQYSTTQEEARRRRLKHDVEMLLECYSQEGDIMLKNVKSIDEYIDDSLAMVELHLAMQRNFLLKADVWMTALATVIGFFALVPGCFGMNIQHGFEKVPSSIPIFWSITGAIFLATILTGIIVCYFLKNLTI